MIKTNAALKYLLVFFGLFLLAGFSVELSLGLAGLAAIAGGLIVKWWEIQEEQPNSAPETKTPPILEELPSRFLNRFSAKKPNLQQRAQRRRSGLFGRFSGQKGRR
ncbi:MAG: hypothetical protein ACFB8W_14945 [Elainellaceae cyanobacterium]